MESSARKYELKDVLTEAQVRQVIRQHMGDDSWRLVNSEVKPAADGLIGFLGDHSRATLHIASDGHKEIQLFIKRVPTENKPKADFIHKNYFFDRESLVFSVIDELDADNEPNPWCTKALIHNESLLVLPDLGPQGYVALSPLETLDLPHVLVTVAAIARFHAAIANYETKRILAGLPTISQEHAQVLTEPTFKASPWLCGAANLTVNMLNTFSNIYKDIPDLETNLNKLYEAACESLREHTGTLNVLLHKDLWTNNIMYRYMKGTPVSALLIDYQCIRYGPPAFDLTIFLYLTTTKSFRKQFEESVFQHYYAIFSKCLEDTTKQRLQRLGYDDKEFLRWCEIARIFGVLEAICIFPYVLMDPMSAQKTYDDPETFDKYLVNRTEPVLAYCHRSRVFRERQIEVCEEFVERYIYHLR